MNTRINILILQWILTKLGTYIVLRRVWNPFDFQGQRSRGQIFNAYHPCEHSRINILQWILTNLGTYLVLMRVWNPIDFQGHTDPSKCINDQTLRSDTEFCRTSLLKLSDKCPTKLSDKCPTKFAQVGVRVSTLR